MTSKPIVPLALAVLLLPTVGCFRSVRTPEPVVETCFATEIDGGSLVGRDVDILVVMDNSPSMSRAHGAIADALPLLVHGLSTGDTDGDPRTPAGIPARSVRVAVVTSDMGVLGVGTGPSEFISCGARPDGTVDRARAFYGDDGAFEAAPSGEDGLLDPARYTGCEFEQPLASMVKALTPRDSDARFPSAPEDVGARDRGRGNDPRANGWFLRDDAVLLVLLMTDEDDCSTDDPRMFDLGAKYPYGEPHHGFEGLNSRCVRFGDEPVLSNPSADWNQHITLMPPATRYAEALIALKRNPDDVVFAMITGIPSTFSPVGPDPIRDGATATLLLDTMAPFDMQVRWVGHHVRIASSCEQCWDQDGDGRCVVGFNDLNGDGYDAPDCTEPHCEAGTPPRCTVDLDADGVCDPDEVETSYVDANGNFMQDEDEPPLPDEVMRAVPPRRLLRAAREVERLGGRIVVQSICQEDFTRAMVVILDDVREVAVGVCE